MSQKNIHFFLEWKKTHLTVALLVIVAVGTLFAWWIVDQSDRQARADLLQQARLVANAINTEHLQTLSGTEAFKKIYLVVVVEKVFLNELIDCGTGAGNSRIYFGTAV